MNKKIIISSMCGLLLVACTTLYFYAHDSRPAYGPMKLYTLFDQYFTIDPVQTEYQAYQLLKKKPLSRAVTYVAVPWALLINSNNLDKVPNTTVTDGVTVCQHIDFKKMLPICKRMGITTVFTPHVEKDTKFDGITIKPFPHFAINGEFPAGTKDVFYSCIGSDTHWSRRKIFDMKHPRGYVKERGIWHFASQNKEEEKREYQDILSRSVFSLCPRGTGASTIRFWESLQAASAPVLIGDDMMLPQEFDWSQCVVFLSYDDIPRIADILAAIPQEKREAMCKKALEAYDAFQGDNLVSTIRNYFK
jgi:hypothetical protein